MIRICLKIAIGVLATFYALGAQAGFIGSTVEATACFPEICGDPGVTTIGGPISSVVGAGVEFVDGQFGAFFGPSFDFDDTTILITHAATGHAAGNFNGYQFFDLLGMIDAIMGVSILSDSSGFFSGDPSRISFDADNIFINFQSLSFSTSTHQILLGIQFVSVPEPSSLILLGLGLVGIGAARRRKKA